MDNDFQDIHRGETCLIVGNGPSLRDVPIELLKKYPTFGTNRIYLRKDFECTYYVCVNRVVIDQYHDEIDSLTQTKFLSENCGIKSIPLHSAPYLLFSYNPTEWIYEGHTVTFVAMQLAYWMGFKKVGLIGVDHRYAFKGQPNECHLLEGSDPNHFDPHYFEGKYWNNPDLDRSEAAYKMAKEVFTGDRREIINITPDSALDVFPKEDWHTWLK